MGCAKTGGPPGLAPGYSLQVYSYCSKPFRGLTAPGSSGTWKLVEKEYLFSALQMQNHPITMTHVYFKL